MVQSMEIKGTNSILNLKYYNAKFLVLFSVGFCVVFHKFLLYTSNHRRWNKNSISSELKQLKKKCKSFRSILTLAFNGNAENVRHPQQHL